MVWKSPGSPGLRYQTGWAPRLNIPVPDGMSLGPSGPPTVRAAMRLPGCDEGQQASQLRIKPCATMGEGLRTQDFAGGGREHAVGEGLDSES